MNTPRLRIVGCGSPDAGDDALGLFIAESLRGRLPAEAEIRTSTAGGADFLDWCEGIELLILVDAALATESFPTGQWRRLVFPDDHACLNQLASRGTHAFAVGAALELASRLGLLPGEVVVFAVAGSQFELGAGLSPAVQTALADVVTAVKAEVLNRLQTPSFSG